MGEFLVFLCAVDNDSFNCEIYNQIISLSIFPVFVASFMACGGEADARELFIQLMFYWGRHFYCRFMGWRSQRIPYL